MRNGIWAGACGIEKATLVHLYMLCSLYSAFSSVTLVSYSRVFYRPSMFIFWGKGVLIEFIRQCGIDEFMLKKNSTGQFQRRISPQKDPVFQWLIIFNLIKRARVGKAND